MWIAAGVLVPFAALVAAGFWFSRPETEAAPVVPGEIVVAAVVDAGEPRLVRAVEVVVVDAGPPDAGPRAEALPAPLAALRQQVRQCFLDLGPREKVEVRVRYTPTRDGGFVAVAIDAQNPWLAACLEDVFAEVPWHPTGAEPLAPAHHTFSFDPSSD